MSNVALNKPVEEKMNHPESATDGNIKNYNGIKGFADFMWPGTLTVDLNQIYDLFCIRMLLWDEMGDSFRRRDSRIYKYRLLTSIDHKLWNVIHDTGEKGYKGWQVFDFDKSIQVRYIRVHGLYNSVNPNFHVVQLEAYDNQNIDTSIDITFHKQIITSVLNNEEGDGLPIEDKMKYIISQLDELIEKNSDLIKPEPFKEISSQLKIKVRDITAIERSVDSIRRRIIDPVSKELVKQSKIGKISLILGIFFFIVTIVLPYILKWLNTNGK